MKQALLLLAVLATPAFAQQSTLNAVRAKGFVQCGVNTGLAGFSQPDSKGVWKGIDVDLCRAVAAAVFGDASKVRYTPLTAQQRFTALQSGEVDLLARNTTWTITRDTLQRAGERAFGAVLAQHLVLLARQRLAPLVVSFLNGKLFFGFHVSRTDTGARQPAEHRAKPERCPGHEKELSTAGHTV